jgi:hypothetical protein
MGQANHNPRSPQYRGPLPDFVVDGKCQVDFAPNEAFATRVATLRAEAESVGVPLIEPKPRDSDIDVVVTPLVAFVVPMRTVNEHPAAVMPQAQIRIPLVDLKRKAIEVFKTQGHINAEGLIKLDDASEGEA